MFKNKLGDFIMKGSSSVICKNKLIKVLFIRKFH